MCKRLFYLTLLASVLGAVGAQAQESEWIRAAYWDARYPGAWGGGGEAMRDAMEAAGYEILDADQLKTWMDARISDKELSVVVFCKDVVPDTVGETMSANCTLRKYLNAGGKIVWYADWPFYYQGSADGTMVTWGGDGATNVLGFNASTGPNDSSDIVTITDEGVKWGLTQTWQSQRPTSPTVTSDLTVLAVDNSGVAAAWAKHYVANDSFRGFVRLYDTGGMPLAEDVIRLAEYIVLKASSPQPADGAIGVTSPLFQWSPGSFAVWHNVYFGTTPDLGPDDLVASNQPFNLYYHVPGLQDGTTYYWRVDAIEPDGTVRTGDVWSFTSEPQAAFGPNPADGAADMFPTATLSWLPGKGTVEHHLYFGSDADAVATGDATVDQGTTDETTFASGLLRSSTTYYWKIDEIKSDDSVEPGEVWSFTTADGIEGKIIREWWSNIAGTAIAALTGSADYPNNPTGRELVDLFEGPVDWADNYGTRLYGWLVPPETGDYTFWIAGDDYQELWLSTDVDPANAVMIANVPGYTSARDFDNTGGTGDADAQKSDPIALVAGQKYYIGALGKEGGGGDSTSVAWQVPGGTREVIPGEYVDTFALPPLTAFGPTPANGETDTAQSLDVTWGAGADAVAHHVYLGDDVDAVADADTTSAEYKGRQAGAAYMTGPLAWGKTYYWRVDEEEADGTIRKGAVWSFTTADFLGIEDFEGYDDDMDAGTAIFQTWIDGWENGTTSVVGYFEAVGGTFCETSIVQGGGQSMPFEYNNVNSPYYAEAERTWNVPQNWTVEGVTDLSLWVKGNPPSFGESADGTIMMGGAGTDIWGNTDEFRYAYKTLNGDGEMIARVVSNGTGSNAWAKGGVMIRESTAPASKHMFMAVTGSEGGGIAFQGRQETSGVSTSFHGDITASPPYWVRLTRVGNTITAYCSADGVDWVQFSDTTPDGAHANPIDVAMANSVLIGLAVTSHASGELRGYTFDNVVTTGGVIGAWTVAEIGVTGQGGNGAGQLYVVVEDSAARKAVIPHPDPLAVFNGDWTPWKIPVSEITAKGVNMAAVKKMYIGVGDRDAPAPGGGGLILVDTIRMVTTTE